MKAFLSVKYGPPETLRLAEVEKPAPHANEVLVNVLAVSVNPADWHSLRGKPVFARATLGLLRPKNTILGVDIAGRVEAVGRAVTRCKPGDEVYANLLDHGFGGFAEYVAVPIDVLALKPANLSFEEAAAVPMAGVTALQGLSHHGDIGAGQKVLVNGASGGVGHFAVQIAKSYGAAVTGVTSTRNIDLVRSLGVDHIIDYTRTDFTRTGQAWDRILDTIGNRSASDLRRALAPGGKCAVIGFKSMGQVLGIVLRGGKQILMVSAHATTKDLDLLRGLIEAGKLRPVIDRRYPFTELPEAIRYLEEGHARGKVVVGDVGWASPTQPTRAHRSTAAPVGRHPRARMPPKATEQYGTAVRHRPVASSRLGNRDSILLRSRAEWLTSRHRTGSRALPNEDDVLRGRPRSMVRCGFRKRYRIASSRV